MPQRATNSTACNQDFGKNGRKERATATCASHLIVRSQAPAAERGKIHQSPRTGGRSRNLTCRVFVHCHCAFTCNSSSRLCTWVKLVICSMCLPGNFLKWASSRRLVAQKRNKQPSPVLVRLPTIEKHAPKPISVFPSQCSPLKRKTEIHTTKKRNTLISKKSQHV